MGDGGESDLDLGNYERFLSISLTSDHNITTGKIYQTVISKERRGDYLGKTVQVVPHITDEIQDWIERVAHIPVDESCNEVADVCLIEVGGTVGDIESSVFLEALRQFQFRVGDDNFCLMFVSLVPILSQEQKTKPTQHGVKDLRSLGLSPKVIFCRSEERLQRDTCNKISSFCHVPPQSVLSVHNVNNVYHVPLMLMEQNLHKIISKELNLQDKIAVVPDMTKWSHMAHQVDSFKKVVKIALIGKYTGFQDSYLSVIKSLMHASIACERKLELVWVEATQLEENDPNGEQKQDKAEYDSAWEKISTADGVIVPGGFGNRGFLGKVLAANYCRINNIPILGICLGFQAMVVEYARNVLGHTSANSSEFDESTEHPVVFFMPEIDKENMGGTMRLGSRITKFTHDHDDNTTSTAKILYGNNEEVSERHRHRYEVNPDYVDAIHSAGLAFVGRDEKGERMEVAELKRSTHPYYMGCQYHPEFKSRPMRPSPPFLGLILASSGGLDEYLESQKEE